MRPLMERRPPASRAAPAPYAGRRSSNRLVVAVPEVAAFGTGRSSVSSPAASSNGWVVTFGRPRRFALRRSSAFAGRIKYPHQGSDRCVPDRALRPACPTDRLVVAIALVVLAYVGLLVLYAVSGHTRGIGTDEGPPPGGVRVELKPEDIDGAAERMTVGIDLSVDSSLVDEGALTLARSVTVVIDPSAGTRQVTFPAGQIPAVNRVQIVLDGDIRNWPLDNYRIRLLVGAYDGSPETGSVLDSTVSVDGEVQGWRIAVEPNADLTGFGFHVFDIDVRRSGDTLAFAGIMLLVLIACRWWRGSSRVGPIGVVGPCSRRCSPGWRRCCSPPCRCATSYRGRRPRDRGSTP